ncbi:MULTISPECIES: hypothetical protein [unclassified Pseudomonas]|uniref:hypothetical protein n=1 Tax=unclassified Pseudomonas TaxID=196821 RepID=UPI000A1F5000|nr:MULTISPECIES: hypothetical protein [unclassified Pseudomonas]
MRILLGVVGALLLTGCSTMEEKRAEGPARSFTSNKDAATVAECSLFAWQSQKWAGVIHEVTIQPLQGGGKTIVSVGQPEFADFIPTASGSEVKVYFVANIFETRRDRRAEAIRGCL